MYACYALILHYIITEELERRGHLPKPVQPPGMITQTGSFIHIYIDTLSAYAYHIHAF
jgi:hypothetical protein